MSRASLRGLQRALGCSGSTQAQLSPNNNPLASGALFQHVREYAAPEFYGRPSHYTQGTDFLGTPPDHLERVEKRPVSPHVFDIDHKHFHYRMPVNAISSITNRGTGVALSLGFLGVGWIALAGDLSADVAAFKESFPYLVLPAKAAVAGPLVFHYLGGVRHLVWDKARIGNQASKNSFLDLAAVDKSSYLLFAATAVSTLGLALYSI